RLAFVARLGEGFAQQLRRVGLCGEAGLEVDSRGESEVGMARAGVTPHTPMSTSPIGVQRLAEPPVRRVVVRDDALSALDRDLRLRPRVTLLGLLEPAVVGRIARPLLEAALGI